MTPEVRPGQLPLEFRTGVVDHWARRTMSTTALLRRLPRVIAGGGAIWRRVTVKR